MGEAAKPTIDDMCEDFEGALSRMTDHVVAEIDRETAGMDEIQLADYWLANARKHISELKDIEARGGFVPEFIMERAEEVAARRRDRVQSVQQARSQAIDDCIKAVNVPMAEILLRLGELSAQEKRTVQAFQTVLIPRLEAMKNPSPPTSSGGKDG
jgi:hypothetical protein